MKKIGLLGNFDYIESVRVSNYLRMNLDCLVAMQQMLLKKYRPSCMISYSADGLFFFFKIVKKFRTSLEEIYCLSSML